MFEEGTTLDQLLHHCRTVGIPFIVVVRERSGGGSVAHSSVKIKSVESKIEEIIPLTEVPAFIEHAKKQKSRGGGKSNASTKQLSNPIDTPAPVREKEISTNIDVEILGAKADSKTKRRISFNCQAKICS